MYSEQRLNERDIIINYLVREGLADDAQRASKLYENMSDEWLKFILMENWNYDVTWYDKDNKKHRENIYAKDPADFEKQLKDRGMRDRCGMHNHGRKYCK
jgi:hypothetical protein